MRLSSRLIIPLLASALATVGCLHAASTASTASAPTAFTARYQVSRAGQLLGEAVLTLKTNGSQGYILTDRISGNNGAAALLAVSIDQRSSFRWHAGKPETLAFDYRLDSALKSKERHLKVDWQAQQVTVDNGRSQHQYPTQAGLVDVNLLPLAIGLQLRAGQHDIQLPIAVKQQVDIEHFRVVGHETVQVPAGRFQAQKVERSGDQSFSAWYAAKRYPLPVKLAQQEGGDLTLQLVQFQAQ